MRIEKRTLYWVFFIVALLGSWNQLFSQNEALLSKFQNRTIIAKGDYHFPPYEYINEDGVPDGFNVELFRQVMKRLGLNYKLILEDWGKVRNELDNGEIDMLIGVINSPERAK